MLKNRGRRLNKGIAALRMLMQYTQVDAGQVSKCKFSSPTGCPRERVDGVREEGGRRWWDAEEEENGAFATLKEEGRLTTRRRTRCRGQVRVGVSGDETSGK